MNREIQEWLEQAPEGVKEVVLEDEIVVDFLREIYESSRIRSGLSEDQQEEYYRSVQSPVYFYGKLTLVKEGRMEQLRKDSEELPSIKNQLEGLLEMTGLEE